MLPSLTTPKSSFTLPLSKRKITLRPMLAKEEKVLLIALESQKLESVHGAIRDILFACSDGSFDANKESQIEVESTYIELRKLSRGPIMELIMKHRCKDIPQDKPAAETPHRVDFNDAKLSKEGKPEPIQLTDKIILKMRYPSYGFMATLLNNNNNKTTQVFDMIAECIEAVFYTDEDGVEHSETPDKKELGTWIDTFTTEQLEKLMQFFNDFPQLELTTKFICSHCKEPVEFKFRGILDFFR